MNKRLRFLIIFAILILAAVFLLIRQQAGPLFECTDAIGCVTILPDKPVKLAMLQPLTGRLAALGTVQSRGLELALAHRDNRLLGHPVASQIEDSQCSPEGGANAALRVVADPQIVAIMGTACSSAATTASKIMSEAGLVMVSGSNSSAALTSVGGQPGPDWHPGYFRTISNGVKMGSAAAIFAFRELGATRAATINEGEIHSKELTEMFEQTFTELCGDIVLATAVNKGDTNMKPVLTAVADAGAQFLFLPIFPPEANFITLQAREVKGLEKTVPMLCGSPVINQDFIDTVGEAGVGAHIIRVAQPSGEASSKLLADYEAKYGEPPQVPSLEFAYDATNLILHAMETVAVQTGDGTLHIGRQALRDAMYATSGFEGVTGTLTCDKFGDCGGQKFEILRLDDPSAGVEGLKLNVVHTHTPGQ